MSLLIQHGYGKTDKVEVALAASTAQGVILSPKSEKPTNLESFLAQLASDFPKSFRILDPQFHYTTCVDDHQGRLGEYPYYSAGLKRKDFLRSADVAGYVSKVFDFQESLSLSANLSPTVLVRDLNDPWSQVSMQLLAESASYAKTLKSRRDVFASLIVSEDAFLNKRSVDDFLDLLTSFEIEGFYFVLDRNEQRYQQRISADVLAHLLYFFYSLADINRYKVVVGYTDLLGILFKAVGVSSCACGWHGSLCLFSSTHLDRTKKKGGKPARPRYTSAPLLNSVLVFPELDTACSQGMQNHVASNTSVDSALLANRNAPWDAETKVVHHWETLSSLYRRIEVGQNVTQRLAIAEAMIDGAINNYKLLLKKGVVFDPSSDGRHLEEWRAGVQQFKAMVKL